MKLVRWIPDVDGILSEPSLRKKPSRLGYRAIRYEYLPGTFFPDHVWDVDKRDAAISGLFRMMIEGEEVVPESGDRLAVHRGTIPSAEVRGDDPVICLDRGEVVVMLSPVRLTPEYACSLMRQCAL